MSALTKFSICDYGCKTAELNEYVSKLKCLKDEGIIEDVDSIRREHIITGISLLQEIVINNLDINSKVTIYKNGDKHSYNKAELLFEVLDELYLMFRKRNN